MGKCVSVLGSGWDYAFVGFGIMLRKKLVVERGAHRSHWPPTLLLLPRVLS